MDTLIKTVLTKENNAFRKHLKRRYGLNISWYSDTFGRVLLSGTIVYEAEKNYRSKYKYEENMNKSCYILLINKHALSILSAIHDIDDIMCHQEFKKPDIFMIGTIGSNYKKENNKRFYINTESLFVYDTVDELHKFIEKRTTFDCIFHSFATQKDSMLS